MKLSIREEILNNLELDDTAIQIMLVMNGCRSEFKTTAISPVEVFYYLYNTTNITRRVFDRVKNSFESLIDKEVLNPVAKIKDTYIFNTEDLFIDTTETNSSFSIIDITEYEKLKHNPTLLRYYLVLISTINSKDKVGFTTLEKLSAMVDITKKTAIEYNKQLKEMQLIYIHNEDLFVNGRKTSNTYGRYEDKEIVIAKAINYKNKVASVSNFITGDEARRISKQYNDFCKGCFKGDVDQLIKDCKRYNSCRDNNKKDMSVFDKVDV